MTANPLVIWHIRSIVPVLTGTVLAYGPVQALLDVAGVEVASADVAQAVTGVVITLWLIVARYIADRHEVANRVLFGADQRPTYDGA